MNKDDITGLVPEIYYDVIARIAAGVTVLVFVISPTWQDVEKSTSFASFIALLGLGYIVGHVLTTVSAILNYALWRPCVIRLIRKFAQLNYEFRTTSVREIFDTVYTRLDWVSMQDKSGAAILKKMEAGAALTDSLFAGWIVVLLYSWFDRHAGWNTIFGDRPNYIVIIPVTILLFLSIPIRRTIFIIRQDRILRLLKYDPSAVEP